MITNCFYLITEDAAQHSAQKSWIESVEVNEKMSHLIYWLLLDENLKRTAVERYAIRLMNIQLMFLLGVVKRSHMYKRTGKYQLSFFNERMFTAKIAGMHEVCQIQ